MVILRRHPLTAAVTALAAVATIVIGVVPALRFAYRSPGAHVALETAAGLIALLAAYLVLNRYRNSGRLTDLLLVCALALFAASNLLLAAVPAAASASEYSRAFSTWAPLCGRLLGSALFAASALLGERRVRERAGAMATALAACLIMVAGIAVGVAVSAEGLPLGIDPSLSPRTARIVTGQPALLSLQLVAMGLYAAAAIGFVRRADEREDELFRWFAAGAGLAAFAHLNYFLFPSLYSEWVHTGDFLRLAFYLVLLAGAAREIGGYWQAAAAAAILEERRRMARDLHDGLAQELAFIRVQARRLADNRRADEVVEQISVAAERALDESRRAIAALTRPLDEPFGSTLTQVAEDIAVRMGLRLEFDVDDEVDAPPETREALLRVVREAVTNAGRHAQAGRVRIELRNGHGLRLRIRDDGAGFDPARPQGSTASGGFGLTSMQERVRALGGELRIASEPGAGTAIEVHVP